VWFHFKVTGTHTGEWAIFGVISAPTGKKISYTGVGIWRIVDGKVVERKSVRDMLDFLKQLGVIEPTEKAKKVFRDVLHIYVDCVKTVIISSFSKKQRTSYSLACRF